MLTIQCLQDEITFADPTNLVIEKKGDKIILKNEIQNWVLSYPDEKMAKDDVMTIKQNIAQVGLNKRIMYKNKELNIDAVMSANVTMVTRASSLRDL